jgi:hypothetical protein
MNETIIIKIKKLLSLAENNSSVEESESALTKAMEMATKHDIEIAKLERNSSTATVKEPIIKDWWDMGIKKTPVSHVWITGLIKEHFKVRVIKSGGRSSGVGYYFVGTKRDIEFAKYLINYLSNTFTRLWKSFYSKNPHISLKGGKESFFFGLNVGLDKKLSAAKEMTVSQESLEDKQSYSLTIIDHTKALQTAVESFFPTLGKARVKRIGVVSDAYEQGFSDGGNININTALE